MWVKQVKVINTPSQHGFTIVELLIVIVVIGILAAITIVAYSGVQAKAHDAVMRNGVTEMAKAVQLLGAVQPQALSTGGNGTTLAVSGGSCVGGTGGWVVTGIYACTLEDMLNSASLLPTTFMSSLPPNKNYGNSYRFSLMYYPCGSNKVALFNYLESPTAADTANLNAVFTTCGVWVGLQATYGMQAATVISY